MTRLKAQCVCVYVCVWVCGFACVGLRVWVCVCGCVYVQYIYTQHADRQHHTEYVEDFTNDVNIELEFKKMFYIIIGNNLYFANNLHFYQVNIKPEF